MRETTDERMAVAPQTPQRAPGAALTAIAVVIALLLGGILAVLIVWVPETRPWSLTCRDAGRC